MKKLWLFLLLLPVAGWGANADNRPVGAADVRTHGKPVDSLFVISFSTIIPANTDVNLLGDHWATYNSTSAAPSWTSGITYSTTPPKSNGGRTYVYFQFLSGSSGEATLPQNDNQRLHWNFGLTAATQTTPSLRVGESFPPVDWPFVYQSTITVRSTATAAIAGYIITEKSRR